jgi:hypothetical protein
MPLRGKSARPENLRPAGNEDRPDKAFRDVYGQSNSMLSNNPHRRPGLAITMRRSAHPRGRRSGLRAEARQRVRSNRRGTQRRRLRSVPGDG